ncbi:hypothetical protein HZA86_02910 [Candidatus Uhrbacteria bacterium]|nr:hypothetical protein [Candidatus Uhrbacteria bacterium]
MTTHTHDPHKPHHESEPSSCCTQHTTEGDDHQSGGVADEATGESSSVLPKDRVVLDELKRDILESIRGQRRAPVAWGSVTVTVVLGLLAVVSVVQATQSASLYAKLKAGDFQSAASPGSNNTSAPAGLPNQVGGC